MSRELKELRKSQKDNRADKNEIERRKKEKATESRKRTRIEVSHVLDVQQRKVLASQYRLAYEGYKNISLAPTLTPIFAESPMCAASGASSSTRSSYTLRSTLFRLIPQKFWTTIYMSLCESLRSKAETEQKVALIRRNASTTCQRQRYSAPKVNFGGYGLPSFFLLRVVFQTLMTFTTFLRQAFGRNFFQKLSSSIPVLP
jgi:hypothetical protein